MDWTKLWPSLVAGLPTILAPFYESITAWISAHPDITLVLGALTTIIANVTKSPTQPSA